ncbi:uroporphyrinogen decarboxylase family protein [Chloroflexota bacterium]
MNSKERSLRALRARRATRVPLVEGGGEPDRVPMYVTVVTELAEGLSQITGIKPYNCDAYLTNRISHAEILTRLGNDVVGIGSTAPGCCPTVTRPDGYRVDEWGLVYRQVPHDFGVYQEVVDRPLSGITSAGELARYRMPDPGAAGRFDVGRDHSQRYGRDFALLGVIECTVFEMAWNLVGLEQFLVDMALRKEYVGLLLDEVADYSIGVGLELIALGADIMLTGDDLGMDIGPMISPRMWRAQIKPRLKRVLDAYRAANPDIILAYHSCGSVRPFIDELIEAGVEVLNPIQVTADGMDPAALKAQHGDRLAFLGGVDQRHVLPQGTAQEVDTEVRNRIWEMGQGGGYMAAPTHDIQADTPVENVLQLFQSVKHWGQYPLQAQTRTG